MKNVLEIMKIFKITKERKNISEK